MRIYFVIFWNKPVDDEVEVSVVFEMPVMRVDSYPDEVEVSVVFEMSVVKVDSYPDVAIPPSSAAILKERVYSLASDIQKMMYCQMLNKILTCRIPLKRERIFLFNSYYQND